MLWPHTLISDSTAGLSWLQMHAALQTNFHANYNAGIEYVTGANVTCQSINHARLGCTTVAI